ncbi:FAD-dependent monooxygenase [[Mycobacterium] crassicus]|uniref:FAD-dependent monooxygenase n=1 Tax=[Mycobacterium] crassicus TaxID=2872309 RepID=A0ABU5XMC8_9MYCO|nr:FAD-dependent monooxygenase [Mycolicibacter sp. MYC098]MEB3023144.1 FAD-dependent monooxygenase [Mycolicibacter sp. MYC098]
MTSTLGSQAVRRVAVLGGGPAGLYTARLLKLARPGWEISLYEQFDPTDTFGFGVGLSLSTQRNLAQSDPDTLAAIVGAAHRGHGSRMYTHRGMIRLDGQETLAIARSTLLQILCDHAESIGVRMHIGAPRHHHDVDADIIVAADGGGSATRRALADELGVTITEGRQRYLWCGTDFALSDALFAPVATEFGTFTCHAYPYAADRSTFLVETDEATWQAAGLETASATVEADQSDHTAIAYLEAIFTEQLGGHRLLGNRSRWNRFRTVRCQSWYTGNVVMVGDAAHTAHYSIGSGTKLAMEDAIALCEALTAMTSAAPADLTDAFARYQATRTPTVNRLQQLADRSQLWWESYPRRLDFSPEKLAMSFVSRAGNVPLEAFTKTAPDIVAPALTEYGAGMPPDGTSVVDWVVAQPLTHSGRVFPSRVVNPSELAGPAGAVMTLHTDISDTWGADADRFVADCAALLHGGATGVRLTGSPERDAILARLDLAERLRLELTATDALIVVDGPPALLADLASGLVSARTDLISVQSGPGR